MEKLKLHVFLSCVFSCPQCLHPVGSNRVNGVPIVHV